jgi:hypothetical protein
LTVNKKAIDTNTDKKYEHDHIYVKARAQMPEKQLFEYAEYRAQEAERTGYSEYSYWKSVWRNFLKKKSAVVMLIVFALLFVFTFVAAAISKYNVFDLRIEDKLMFTSPNSEFWFGTDNLGRDIFSRVLYGARLSVVIGLSSAAIATVTRALQATDITTTAPSAIRQDPAAEEDPHSSQDRTKKTIKKCTGIAAGPKLT